MRTTMAHSAGTLMTEFRREKGPDAFCKRSREVLQFINQGIRTVFFYHQQHREVPMKTYICSLLVLLVLMLSLPNQARAVGGSSDGMYTAPADPDFERAKKEIKARNWDAAIELLKKALARDPKNAEIHNQLGFAERNRGDLDAAFNHYERALALDPKHRGAHEYLGEAYLKAGNLAKAEEHLAVLNKLCFFPCEEYRDLKAAVAAYKQQPKKD